MQMNLNFDQVVAHLRKLKEQHGDETFHEALKGLFRSLLQQPGADQYIQKILEAFAIPTTFEDVKREVETSATQPHRAPPSPSPVDVVRQAIEQEMPHCKTQAHFDLVIQAWTSLKVYLDACYGFDRQRAAQAREGLNRLLDLAPQVAQMHAKLQETPEATTNRDYVEPARELTEHHKQQTLLAELQDLDSFDRMQTWYSNAKPIMDTIVSQKLRDELYDAIRVKKHALIN